MRYIPGSHKEGVRRHGFMNGDPRITTLILEEEHRCFAGGVAAGADPVAPRSIITARLHGSGPNTTDNPRRAYVNEWQIVPVKRDVSRMTVPGTGSGRGHCAKNNNKLEVEPAYDPILRRVENTLDNSLFKLLPGRNGPGTFFVRSCAANPPD